MIAMSFLTKLATKIYIFSNPDGCLHKEFIPIMDLFKNLKEERRIEFRTIQGFEALSDYDFEAVMEKAMIPNKIEAIVIKQVLKKQRDKFN